MANPRQRRKARSSSHKPVSHSRRAKKLMKKTPPIRGPKALQDAWDKHKTVRQNYAALGLVSNLNPLLSGGIETIPVDTVAPDPPTASRKDSVIPMEYGRIVRDADGNVIGVELPKEDQESERNQANHDIQEMKDPEVDSNVLSDWVQDLRCPDGVRSRGVVPALENLSSLQSSLVRFSSGGEVAYLGRLVEKYGEDVESMARDRRLNTEQRTAGQLRRAIRKAGGTGKLMELGHYAAV